MSEKQHFILRDEKVKYLASCAVLEAQEGWVVEIKPPTRSLEQNARLWSMLGEIAEQVPWHGQKLSAEDYKDMFTASLRKARVVPGLDPGSFVVMGLRTSQMTKSEMSDLFLLIEAFAAERGVVFNDPTYADSIRS